MTILPAHTGAHTPTSRPLRLDVVLYADVASHLVAPDLGGLRTARPEFVAGSWMAVASVAGEVVGCARAEPTAIPFPDDGPARLGRDRCDGWLSGGLQLVELVVADGARRRGVGSLLASTVCAAARRGRVWTVLRGRELAALGFFLERGWVPVTDLDEHDVDGAGGVVLLSGTHAGVLAGRVG